MKVRKYMTDKEAKRYICETGHKMYKDKYVIATAGNISARVGEDAFWVTPTQTNKGNLTEDMLVKVDSEGNVIAGNDIPSSEMGMHLAVYKENPEINAICHAHPVYATSLAIAGLSIEKPILAEMVMQLNAVPLVPYYAYNSKELGEAIAKESKKHNGALLANHGVITWGFDLFEAYQKLEAIEHYAHIFITTDSIIKKANEIEANEVDALRKAKKAIDEKRKSINFKEMIKKTKEQEVNDKVEELEDVYRGFVNKFYARGGVKNKKND